MNSLLVRMSLTGALCSGIALARIEPEPAVTDATADAAPTPVEPPPSRLEREALARFAGSTPRVRLPNGSQLPPSNDKHASAIKLNAYKTLLVREETRRDPTFALKAEAELEARRPVRATLRWEDESGGRETRFIVDDSTSCQLEPDRLAFELPSEELPAHTCLASVGSLGEITQGKVGVELEPIDAKDRAWSELLRATMRELAAQAHLARAEPGEAI